MTDVCKLWVPGALGPGGSSKGVTGVIPEAPLICTASMQAFILQSALLCFSFCFGWIKCEFVCGSNWLCICLFSIDVTSIIGA